MNDAKSVLTQSSETNESQPLRCTAFSGPNRVASGELAEVARKARQLLDTDDRLPILVFDDVTSELIEIDFRGTPDEVAARLARTDPSGHPASSSPEKRGPGRPKLGVVAREITLLPRHWVWLDGQPGGASVALRKLVEEAKRANRWKDNARQSQEAVYRFLSAMAGDLPGFEEALRVLYARRYDRLDAMTALWPKDIREHVNKLVAVLIQNEAAVASNAQTHL